MIAPRWRAALLLGGGLLLLPLHSAGSATRTAPPAASARAARARAIDPGALQAVRNMSAYLRTLSDFEIRVATNREEIGPRGRLVRYRGTIDYKVRRPNGFVIRSDESGRRRELVYDGRSLTLFTPNSGYWAQTPAPPTIRQTLAVAADRYDIHPPLVDLFKWSAGDARERRLTSARFVGVGVVDGLPVDTYAFRRPGRAWRISIVRGPDPVPVRISVASTDTPRPLRFSANLAWKTRTQFAADTFAWRPPAGSRRIGIATG